MLSVIFDLDDAVLPVPQIHVSAKVEATDEKRCYDVTKPDPFLSKVFASTLILLTWNQVLSFFPNYGTALPGLVFFGLWSG